MMSILKPLKPFIWLCFYLVSLNLCASGIVNVYLAGGDIPISLIWAFQKETGIKVNVSTYDNNETMYAKLRASKKNIYDIILPSSYYVERMKKFNLLTKLDPSKLPNLKNLDPSFTNNPYDPKNQYHVPLVWGVTGIFYNQHWIKHPPQFWRDLWQHRWANQLMLVDDTRDVFSIALMSLGYNPNDTDPKHIKAAYQQLLRLIPNIKLFAYDAIQSLIIDEDANIGQVWNGDVVKAQAENSDLRFVYPKDGCLIWIDCLAIPVSAPHPNEAYQFINFLLRATSGAQIVLEQKYSVTNHASWTLLPENIRNNPYIFPPKELLKHGYYQRDVGESVIELYNEYWEKLKLAC